MSTLQIVNTVTAEWEVAARIAVRMSQIGWVEDNDVVKALSKDWLPAVELLVDGQRYLVTVELAPGPYQPRATDPVEWADGAVQEVLF